jgi:MerR family transcriptional regulator, light-induced transcriptional regulator
VSVEIEPDNQPRIRIGELSRRTGVGVDALRAWERRYAVLEPTRSDGGFRLYGVDDEARARGMSELIASGLSAAQAAEAIRARAPLSSATPPGALDGDEAARLADALARLDEGGAEAILDRVFATLSLESASLIVVLPALRELGERWERGEVSIAEEHFASSLIRSRLLSLSRGWGGGGSQHAVLACPSGEQHDLGLIVFGLVLRGRGWRITYLGPDTPVETIAEAADKVRADAVVVSSLAPERLVAESGQLKRMAGSHRVLLAGSGALTDLAREIGAESLPLGPVEAARKLSGA